ncbi:MAG TPA: hypothetical protein VGN06_07795 [Gaiellaceae bacterium]|jgi:hypothetical protein
MRLATAIALLLLGHQAAAGPTNRVLPSVVGAAQAGSHIVGLDGTWSGSGTVTYSYRWDRCDGVGANCAAVASVTRPTYQLTSADVGKTLGFIVTAKDKDGSTKAYASLIGPVAAASSLGNIGRPIVSGTAAVGSSLSVTPGIWATTPASVTYSWLQCDALGRTCVAIAGAATASYQPAAADIGHTLVARVQATSGTLSQVVLSGVSGIVGPGSATTTITTTTTTTTTTATPSPSTRPVVTGTVKVGQRLTGTTAGATGYQWYRCDAAGAHCFSIHGAVAATYTAVAKDAGQTLALAVKTGTTSAYASLVGPVAAATAAASTVQPPLTGNAVQAQTLTVGPGTWSASTSSVAYAWQRCNANGRICAPIAGATAASYVPVADDVGHAVAVVVTATIAGKTAAAFSVASDDVLAPPALAATTQPAVTGTLKSGQQITGSTGTWTGTAPIAFAVQWYRCDATGAHCSSVHGATKPTYRLSAKDIGKTIGLTVNATDGTGTKKVAYASLVGPIAAAAATFVSTAQPKVTVQGQTLTVEAATWSTSAASTTVQWERCNANGRICTPIAGATSTAYVATAADTGHALVALVTAHSVSLSASALSAATAAP